MSKIILFRTYPIEKNVLVLRGCSFHITRIEFPVYFGTFTVYYNAGGTLENIGESVVVL